MYVRIRQILKLIGACLEALPSVAFILVFCSVLKHSSELDIVETSIFDWSVTEEFINLFMCETIAHLN